MDDESRFETTASYFAPDRLTNTINTDDYFSLRSTAFENRTTHTSPTIPTIPGYTVHGLIARGGMGCVFAATDLTFDREVAIKTLRPHADDDRFLREAKITARLSHPGIPPVYALGRLDDDTPYLVMKRVHGQTLAAILKDYQGVSSDSVGLLSIFEQTAAAVGFAHSKGIIHRDLKPLNVMVGEFGEVQVMDWGLAKAAEVSDECRSAVPAESVGEPPEPPLEEAELRNRPAEARRAVTETHAGTILGTPGYMAPEQARGEPVDSRADVFALGAIFAACLTGKPAFTGSTAREIIDKTAQAAVDEVRDRLTKCRADPELVAVALQCLSADRNQRPMDGRAVAAMIAAYRANLESRLRRAETARAETLVRTEELNRRRRLRRNALLGLAAILSVGIVGTTLGMLRAVDAAEQQRIARIDADIQRQDADRARELALKEKAAAVLAEERTYQAFERLTSNDSLRFLTTLKNISPDQRVFLNEAANYFRNAATQAGTNERDRARAARSHFQLGSLLAPLGQTDDAAEAHRRSLSLREELVRDFPTKSEYLDQLACSRDAVAWLLAYQGNHRDAEAEYRQALALRERIYAQSPDDLVACCNLAITHDNLGLALVNQGKHEDAERNYRRAIQLLDADPASAAKDRRFLREGIRVRNHLGNLFFLGRQDPRAAEQVYRMALALHAELCQTNKPSPLERLEEARIRNNLGVSAAFQGHRADAQQEFRQAAEILLALLREFPGVPEYRCELAGSYANFGRLFGICGEAQLALKWYEQALPILNQLIEMTPKDVTTQDYLRNTHSGRAIALETLRRYREAAAAWSAALHCTTADHSLAPVIRAGRVRALADAGLLEPFALQALWWTPHR